jgi:hypothetical protein
MSALLSFDASLRRALFDLVVSTACADPMMSDLHIDAVRGVQIALGLVDDGELGVLSQSTTGSWRELARATERERSIAYAAVVWVALADDVIDDGEARLLADVRRELRLGDAAVRLADSLARHAIVTSKIERLPPHRAFARLVVDAARHDARRRVLRAA